MTHAALVQRLLSELAAARAAIAASYVRLWPAAERPPRGPSADETDQPRARAADRPATSSGEKDAPADG